MEKKYFARYREPLTPMPDLVEAQRISFQWFLDHGLNELFQEFSPILDYSAKELALDFVDFSIDEPKYDERHARSHNLSFEAPLRARVRLTNKETGEEKEQEIYMADLPLMTPRGTFIVNGVERVIVPQLARSFGLYFTANDFREHRRFGAKIIPNRGAWIEIETEEDGVMWARIDRKRKFPISALLRVFGMEKDEEILAAFSGLGEKQREYITRTLEKDTTKTTQDAYIDIYKKIRPGELATLENAKELLEGMFSEERYDLSPVGRYKVNQRLGRAVDNIKEESRIITKEDLVSILSYVTKLNETRNAQADDIDHLGNRRVRVVGEMLQQRLRVGMARVKRTVQDRMSTFDIHTLTPAQLVNARPFVAVLKEFFTTNQLSQFMNQQNILSEVEHLRRLSAMGPGGLTRERAGFEVRDVHPSHYGRICPIATPEGPNIGLVVHLALYARLNEYGILETPYRKVKNGKILSELVYMNAFEEMQYNIAHANVMYDEQGNILDETVEARRRGSPGLISREEVDFIDVSSQQAFSVATGLIPFLEHDDANRALMGSNMQRQAVPCVKPQTPLVGTGVEDKVVRDSGRIVVAEENGEVTGVEGAKVTVKYGGKKPASYDLVTFLRSNDFTTITQRPVVEVGQKVKKGDVLVDTSSSEYGHLALGQNVVVAFLSWGGANFEDAIIISERLVQDDLFSSVHIEEFQLDVRDTKLGPEITTHDIINVSEEKLKDLDEEGIVNIGAEVRSGDILVGKISPKGEVELTPEERLLRSIFGEKVRDVKDTSLRLSHGKQGRVVGVKIFSRDRGDKLETGIIRRIQVEVAQLRKVSVGDKLAGRHGNKGVISKILPVEDMPHMENGCPVDIILNPMGVPGRMNLGQILETHLGWSAYIKGYHAITPPFTGATAEEIRAELVAAGMPEDGKVKLFDGRTGIAFEQRVTVGCIYMMKLNHMVEDKIHMRSIGPYSLITQQPLGGKAQGGGQRFGEMEVWALEGYGAAHTLQEMLTIKSDDVLGRASAYDAIVRGEKFKIPNLPASFHVLINELKALSLDVVLAGAREEPEEDEFGIVSDAAKRPAVASEEGA